jgi:predicted extracellular nuclease
MKVFLVALLLLGICFLSGLSIYDIQYTSNPGSGNTYPSPYVGKTVTLEGVVTAKGYNESGFFMSEPAGGPWRGIFIRDSHVSVNIGDKLIVRGVVGEYFGMTCLQDVNGIRIVDSNYPLPFANQVTSGQITTPDQAEAYECTLVRVQNATIVQSQGTGANFSLTDGSGPCLVRTTLPTDKARKYKTGDILASVTGIVCYSYGEYSINPRTVADMVIMVPVFHQNRSWGRIKSIYK